MTPKIVTRLANIAAKLAGSDKYDPTIEPVTAFEYYLNKGVDKILAIKGVPAVEAGDVGKVLTVSDLGRPVWTGMLSITATITSATGGTWTGATWDAIKNNIQNGKAFVVTIANTGDLRYVMFNSLSTEGNVEVAITAPFLANDDYQSIVVTSSGDFSIR